MKSLKLFQKQVGTLAAAMVMALTPLVPAWVASADTATGRSVALSSAAKGATNVNYKVSFTTVNAAGAVVVQFCTSPTIGTTCTAPTGMDASSAGTSTASATVASKTVNSATVTYTMAAATAISIDLTGITNPTNPSPTGVFYARIITYDTPVNAATYTDTDLKTGAQDQGSVAISVSDTVAVSGAVLETMTFCVAKNVIDPNCDLTTTPNPAPVVKLGQTVGDVTALQPGVLSLGSAWTQLTTNAASGAVVNMQSDAADCGGLLRAGALGVCDIAASGATGTVAANDAKFGVKLSASSAAPAAPVNSVSGVLQPAATSSYTTTAYSMNFVPGNATGVTSVYGDPIIDSNSLPVSNQNMQLEFAASVNSTTPAGVYSANLSLIATGKF